MVFTNFKVDTEYANLDEKMVIKENGNYIMDKFLDEIALGIKTEKGLFVIVGCSHVGIVNILDTISERINMNIYGVIGGTHLVNSDEEKIKRVISYLKEKKIKLVGVSHCTGEKAEKMLKEELEEFFNNNTGNVFVYE
ncbi:beta-lactamase domain protein [Desulfonispora thiosulfatigenes DSM 11270]|uniref:Beta-lactamase domain protein n=1 Tax=Desulfonispora thiosulfatigenes DSM 11270 TaxID=656914 RepID=A0A1W1UFG5_DESTI|nr:MBL fold metallo-hydrolase [Desulfonispora thiosulfatigenes]SMB79789.1 beta-lactamase domain protein [Desulfonispora thiosulfatigenes DSM 11270]